MSAIVTELVEQKLRGLNAAIAGQDNIKETILRQLKETEEAIATYIKQVEELNEFLQNQGNK